MNTTYLDELKKDTFEELSPTDGGYFVSKGKIIELIDKVALQTKEEMKGVIEGMAFKDPNQAGQFAMHADGYNEAIEEVIEALASTNPSE